jgi:hypothetical protein
MGFFTCKRLVISVEGDGRDVIEAGEDDVICCFARVRLTTVDGDAPEKPGEIVDDC